MPIGIRVARSARRRAAVALAAVAVAAAGLTITLDQNATAGAPAALSRSLAAAAPVTTTAGGVSLTVDPAGGLTAGGGSITVTGSGFKTANGLYVAICHADGKAPASLADCVGGAIPSSNTSNSWAHVTPPGSGTANSGPIVATWGNGGTFTVALGYPASNSASDALDCSKVACAVYTRPDTGSDPSQNLSVPIAYVAAATTPSTPSSSTPASSSTTPTTSSAVTSQQVVTSTIAVVPSTVAPKTIRSASIRAGGSQEVLFAGFTKGEVVSVRLDTTALAAVRADADGIVKIDFVVPVTTPAGTHLLRVSGQKSKTSGIASFLVTAAPVTTTSAPASAPVSSPVSSSAPASSAVIVPPPVSSSPAPSSAPPVSSSAPAPVVAPGATAAGSKLVWPWYVLGLVVLLWAGFAIYMWQRRRSRLADEMWEKDAILAQGAAAEQGRAADAIARANADAPTAYIGPLPTQEPGGYTGYHPGEHGLLSGRDHPDNPGLLSGQQYRPGSTGELPTTFLPPGGSGFPPPGGVGLPAGQPPAGGPPTGAWSPDFTSAAAAPGGAAAPAGGAASGGGADAGGAASGGGADAGGAAPRGAADSGPGTAQWRPDFGDDGADGPPAVPADDGPAPAPDTRTDPRPDGESGGRHSL